MIHGPCGALRKESSCMKDENKSCRFHYPKQFNPTTIQDDNSYLQYRRRDNGRKVLVWDKWLDNRWVVPYNPKLLMMFNCHINVEICLSIKSVKYVYKYIYKGHDTVEVQVELNDAEDISEIRNYQDVRWVSPPEAMWRIFRFLLSEMYPSVRMLTIHLPNQQHVIYRADENLTEVAERESAQKSMLLAFFEKNRQSENARQYLYKDFPMHFTWDKNKMQWNDRKRGGEVGRMVSANPAEGERCYLRLLLIHVKGPTCFEDLLTIDGVQHQTFRKAALERGIIENDDSFSDCLREASIFQFPGALRRLFATILVFCEPGDVYKLWEDHYEAMSEDYRRTCGNESSS